MKYQPFIISYAGGHKSVVARGEIVELTDEEYESNMAAIKETLARVNYFEMGDVIVPGAFFLNNCVFQLVKMP